MSSDQNKEEGNLLRAAQSFEYCIVLVLVAAVALITLIAMVRLIFGIYDAVFISWDIKNLLSVQLLFGMVMTVLISLEFGNSILRHIRERSTIIQAKEVVLIGMMAVVRKIMIIDLSQTSSWQIAALAALAVALSGAYWLMGQRNN